MERTYTSQALQGCNLKFRRLLMKCLEGFLKNYSHPSGRWNEAGLELEQIPEFAISGLANRATNSYSLYTSGKSFS